VRRDDRRVTIVSEHAQATALDAAVETDLAHE
jgi:hypothetical protein